MLLSIYFLSLIFLVLGWTYYYKSARVHKLNDFFRKKIFNDRYMLLKRKKIAVVFFLAACLLFTTGFIRSQDEKKKKSIQIEFTDQGILFDVISLYYKRLAEQPEDILTLTKLAHVYKTLGEKNRERMTWEKILVFDPENKAAKERFNVEL